MDCLKDCCSSTTQR